MASVALANHLTGVSANGCGSVTFTYAAFPNANNNTVHETVTTTAGAVIGTGTAVFNGPSGSSTVPITGGTNGETVIGTASWNTNGVQSPTPPPSFTTTLSCACPPANPAGAHATGSATGEIDDVRSFLGPDITELRQALGIQSGQPLSTSSQAGVGTDSHSNFLISLPADPIVHVNALTSSSVGTVTGSPALAEDVGTATTGDAHLINPGVGFLVNASETKAVAKADASGTSSSVSSDGSSVSGVVINGTSYGTITTPTTVTFQDPVTRNTVTVKFLERISTTTQPPTGTLSGGTYAADVTENAIHVTATGQFENKTTDIIVGHAVAHADFPQQGACK